MESGRISGQGQPTETGVAATVKEKAQDFASTVTEKAEEARDNTRRGVQEAAATVASGAETVLENVTGFMRRYPLATFCAGFGLGCLLTMAFENRYYLRSPD